MFIQDKAFYTDGNDLYVAAALIASRSSININGLLYNINVTPTTTALNASSIEKWSGGGDLTVSSVSGNTCTVEASGNHVTGALYIGIPDATSSTLLITEKKYKDGKITFGLTGTDLQSGGEYGLAYYPFGYGTDLTDAENITAFDGAVMNYRIYAEGLGVCNVTIDYKVGGVVAEANGKKYTTLQDAINAVSTSGTVKLLDDATENVTIPDGKTLTLDLNGCTLNGGTVSGKAALTNYGTVTIKDSKTGGTIKREDLGKPSHYVIHNAKGTMNIESGVVTNGSGVYDPNPAGPYAGSSLICNADKNDPATLSISGGTFAQQNFIVIKNGRAGTLNVSGGTYTTKQSAIQNWNIANINGGEINGIIWTDVWDEQSVGQTTISGNTVVNGKFITAQIAITSWTPRGKNLAHGWSRRIYP